MDKPSPPAGSQDMTGAGHARSTRGRKLKQSTKAQSIKAGMLKRAEINKEKGQREEIRRRKEAWLRNVKSQLLSFDFDPAAQIQITYRVLKLIKVHMQSKQDN
jgi:hypothetical protein